MMGIPVDRIEVCVSAENNDARFVEVHTSDPALPYNIEARVRLDAREASPEQLDVLHRYASERCPMTNLIRTATPVAVIVELVGAG